MKSKMSPYFRSLQGGLFEKVMKADVGDNSDVMRENGVMMLSWADPFYPDDRMDDDVRTTLKNAILDGSAQHYTTPIGNSNLKRAIAEKMKEYNNLEIDPQRNILITPGSDAALFFAVLPFIETDDEVMIVDPSYPNNFQIVQALKGVPISIPVRPETGYELEIEEFEKRLSDKTKLIILTNPNNPTTVVYSRESLEELARFAADHDLIVIVDQAFEDIIFDGREMVTFASLKDMWDRTITIFSISKGMGLSGLRVGNIVASDVLIDVLYASAVSVIGATNTAAQFAAITAYRKRDTLISEYTEIFDRRRRMVDAALSDIPGVETQLSQSAFLSWINISKLGTSDELVAYLIDEAKVFVNTGNAYGQNGEGYIRLVQGCYADDRELESAINRIREALLKRSKALGIV